MMPRSKRVQLALSNSEELTNFSLAKVDTEEKPRVAILARVSSLRQKEEGTIDTQLAECEKLFLRHFGDKSLLVHQSINDGYNLETKDLRFDFWTMLEKVRVGEITHMVAVSLDRLFRGANKVLNAEISQVFTEKGVTLITLDGVKKYDPKNISGGLLDTVQEALGPIEKKNLVRKLQTARRHHLTENKQWRLAVVPFGYKVDVVGSGRGKEFVYTIVEEEAKVVRDIYRMYVGLETQTIPPPVGRLRGVKVLAGHLNTLGVSKDSWVQRIPHGHQARKANKWNAIFINRILTNPIYKGDLVVVFNEADEGAAYEGNAIAQRIKVPAIVSEELWAKVGQVREAKSSDVQELFKSSAQDLNWLHRFIRCPVCDTLLGGYTSSKKERYYMCRYKRKAGDPYHATFRAIDIEGPIAKTLLTRLKKDILWESMHGIRGSVDADRELKELSQESCLLEEKLESLRKEQQRLNELVVKGLLDEDGFIAQRARIHSEINENQTSLTRIMRRLDSFDSKSKLLKSTIDGLKKDFEELMASGSTDILRVLGAAAHALIEEVQIDRLPDIPIGELSLDEIKRLYSQGKLLHKHLVAAGWSERRIAKELGKSGRRSDLNFEIRIKWVTGRTENISL